VRDKREDPLFGKAKIGRLESDEASLPVKGLILAAACLGVFVTTAGLGSKVYRGDREYRIFLGALAGSVLLYATLFAVIPRNLGILPAGALEPDAIIDFWNGALIVVLVSHSIWAFAYMVWTGPTVRILLALCRGGRDGVPFHEMLREFEASDSGNLLLRRRLPKLTEGGYLREQHGSYVLLPRGRAAGRAVIWIKQAIGDLERA
jgi:hypothetical protein